jgi:CheY-like chemotaxis protein
MTAEISQTTVLVIEDDVPAQQNIQELLELEGYRVLTANNGQLGLHLALRHQPDLVLCDIMMPQVDGYQVLQQLQQDPQLRPIPFIFLTAKSDLNELRCGMNLGADDYITKPFTRQALLGAIQIRLRRCGEIQQMQSELTVLRQLNLFKVLLLGGVSHHLRRPLANIKMAIEMLAQPLGVEKQLQYLTILRQECGRGTHLVDDLLEWQRLELNTYTLMPEQVDGVRLMQVVLQRFQRDFEEHQVDLQIQTPIQLNLMTDRACLTRILIELIQFVLTKTPASQGIKVELDQIEDHVDWRITYPEQTSQAHLSRLFEPFFIPIDRGGDCTGLGLALVKKMVERLQGELIAESQRKVTTLILKLPLKLAPV